VKRRLIALLIVLLLAAAPFFPVDSPTERPSPQQVAEPHRSTGTPAQSEDIGGLLRGLPGYFIENQGQVDNPEVRFYAQGDPLSVGITPWGVVFTLREDAPVCTIGLGPSSPSGWRTTSFSMRFEGCNDVEPSGTLPLDHATNFFLGNDMNNWVRGARSYAEVVYEDIYDGVDLRFYFRDGMFKYDLMLDAGVDPGLIVLAYDGVEGLEVDGSTGDLRITTSLGDIRDARPVVFQDGILGSAGGPGSFVLMDGASLTFGIPEVCSPGLPLVIDPGLLFTTLFGASLSDSGEGLAMDDEGNMYIVGATDSPDFATPGAYCVTYNNFTDVFVAKMRALGTRPVFVTYIGGQASDFSRTIDLGPDGGIYVAGNTRAEDFPIKGPAISTELDGYQDNFLVKLSNDGSSLLYGSYIGGNESEGTRNVHVNSAGEVYIIGITYSGTLPTTPNAFMRRLAKKPDAYAVKLDSSLSKIVYCTYIGGTGRETNMISRIDPSGNVYIGGQTNSHDFPVSPGAYSTKKMGDEYGYDCFVFVLNHNGTERLYATYLGGREAEEIQDIAVGKNGSVYITGSTVSEDFPLTSNALRSNLTESEDAFLTVMDGTLSTLEFSTYWGGMSSDVGVSLAFGPTGDVLYLLGLTVSTDFNTTHGAFDRKLRGGQDLYVSGFDVTTWEVAYSTYIGGNSQDGTDSTSHAMKCDDQGMLHIVSPTRSTNFPITPGGNDTRNGTSDVAIIKIDPRASDPPPAPTNLTATPSSKKVSFTWDVPSVEGSRVIRHYLYKGETAGDINFKITLETVLEYDDVFVDNGKQYFYQLTAENYQGEGPRSSIVSAIPLGQPSPPQDFTISTEKGKVYLNWSAPLDTGGGEPLGYHIIRGTSIPDMAQYDIVGNVDRYTDTGVEIGVVYFYAVRAYNDLHNGLKTAPLSVTPTVLPTAPFNFNVTSQNTSALLTWELPLSTGGTLLLTYHLYWGTSEEDMSLLELVPRGKTSHTVSELVNGEIYYFYMTAVNNVGEGPPTETLSVVPRGLPTVPLDFAIAAGDRQASLTWSPPENDGGRRITSYKVYGGEDPGSLRPVATLGDETSYVDKGLTNGVTYYYSVRAVNEFGDGPMTATLPVLPLGLPDPPIGFLVEPGTGLVSLSWIHPSETGGSPITGFNIYRGEAADSLELLVEVPSSATFYTDMDVVDGRTYYYEIRTVTAGGEGSPTDTDSGLAFGPPGAPTNLVAVAGEAQVTLTWSEPDSDGGKPLVGYYIYRGTSTKSLGFLVELANLRRYVDKDVDNGVEYHYVVSALNEPGEGARTDIVSATPVGKPGAPTGFTASLTDGKAVLTWAAPESDGGSPVTGYIILRGTGGGQLSVLETLGVVTTYTDDTVSEGDAYWYAVKVANAIGEGPQSDAQFVEVPKEDTTDGEGGISTGLLIGIVVLVLVVLGAVAFFMKGRGTPAAEMETEEPPVDAEEPPVDTEEAITEEEPIE
jgi:fibronectin type 3 domain-containing protein